MGGYDEVEDLPVPLRPHRGVTVALLALLTVVFVGIVGVFVYALSPLGDPTAGSMPPPGGDREVVYELVPVLEDDAAIAHVVPAASAAERTGLRAVCGPLAGQDPDITIFDDVTPAFFRVVLEVASAPAGERACSIRFRWIEGDGWSATATTY